MPDSYLEGKLALAGKKPRLTVLLQGLGFREDFAISAALRAEVKPRNPPCNNFGAPESFLTAACQYRTDLWFRDPVVSKHVQE